MGPPKEKLEPTKQPLTAVLLADSFTQRFRPITVERPKVLLPLVNAPLIEYTLEWLALNKVEEIFVFCCAHADQIKKYLADSKWLKQRSPRITTVVARNCLSAGEALRALDQKDIIKGDFVLVSGDTVANLDLGPALAAHKARREKDKNAIMTMIMKQVPDHHQRLRLGDAPLVVAVDPANQRLLRYVDYGAAGGSGRGGSRGSGGGHGSVKVDAALFGERDGVQLRSDLMDCSISICAPEVLMLFSDNFDYQHLKRDFVCGVLSEEELGNKVFLHAIQREYAARVHNLRAYDAISRDLLQRWAFPFVPDTNAFARSGTWGPSSYRYARGHRYLEATVSLARSATVGVDVAIGAGTSVGDGTSITHSVVGRGCRIGRNCVLRGAYLQDNVTLGDGCVVSFALLCERAVLKPGAVVQPGAVLSYGVVVGPKHSVPAGSRVSLCKALATQGDSSDDELEYAGQRRASDGARRGGRGSASSSDDDSGSEEGSSSGDGSDSGSSGALVAASVEKPSSLAAQAAEALARGGAAAAAQPGVAFDRSLVGDGGAGYGWPLGDDAARYAAMNSLAPPAVSPEGEGAAVDDDDEEGAAAGGADGAAAGGAAGGGGSDSGESSGDEEGGGGARLTDPEAIFSREVAETYLRCVKLRFDQTNAVIELNGLKIAEDRTFADCARYIFTTMLGLCAPAAPHVASEYRELYPKDAPDVATPAGKVALLKRFRAQLGEWGPLLQRFLKSEDDQVELLLTLEEYCAEEGVFEGAGEAGPLFSTVFAQLLQLLYEGDIVDEEAFSAWAGEKQHADAEERVYLDKAAPFLEWLANADEDEDEDEEGSDE